MNTNYVIVSDVTTDLPATYETQKGLKTLSLKFEIAGIEYDNYLDERGLALKTFYQHLKDGKMAKTRQINTDDALRLFKELISLGKDILYIGFSSGLSGSFNAVRIAKDILLEDYPNAKIILIDSLAASLGQGLIVHYALLAQEEGKTLLENAAYVEGLIPRLNHWFTVGSIDTLRRGGRVSGAAAFIAKTLNIYPVLHVDNDGKLIPRSKKIGRKKAVHELVARMEKNYSPALNKIIFISHGDCLEDALFLQKLIEEKFQISSFLINMIGPVIGSHAGPDTLALFYVGEER